MIQKLKLIGNVGLFVEAKGSHNDLRIDPLTLIYAENGRGKTTLAAILRSLATNDGDYLKERRCLWGTGDPKVAIDTKNGPVVYQDNVWSTRCDWLHVFDDHFVEVNVCSHRTITLEHRRGLHKIVLGEGNVALAQRVETLTAELRDLTKTISDAEKDLKPYIVGGLSSQAFCDLPATDKIEDAIAAKEKDVTAAKAAEEIKNQTTFAAVSMPDLGQAGVATLLGRTLADINAAAEKRVRERFKQLGDSAEAWVEQGFAFPHDENCPFCSQPLKAADIVRDFQAYFSAEYGTLKTSISGEVDRVKKAFSGANLAVAVRRIGEENTKRTFWRRFTEVAATAFPSETIEAAWLTAEEHLTRCLNKKVASPLEPLSLDAEALKAFEAFEQVRREVAAANDDLAKATPAIEKLHANAKSASVFAESAALDRLKNCKARHSKEVAVICDRYRSASKAKDGKSDEKAQAVKDLASQSKSLIDQYQKGINDCLGKFATGFTIEEMKESREAGDPGCSFMLGLRGQKVPLGKPDAPKGTVCFRTVLSGGDRSALALAFFITKLLERPDLRGQTVVLDDPVSSMDSHRQDRTREYIARLIERGAQVVVLSHYPSFLRQVWTHAKGIAVNCIKVGQENRSSVLEPWDIAAETNTDYHKVWQRLDAYLKSPDEPADDIRRSIRLLLEGYLRHQYPALMDGGDRLGQFLETARKSKRDGKPLLPDNRLAELESLNTFSADKSHMSESSDAPGPPNEAAVQSYVKSALEFVAPPPA